MTAGSANQLRFQSLRVRFSNDIRGNFIRLPSAIVNALETTEIPIQEFGIEISQNDKILLHVGWDGYESQNYLNGQPAIEINPILAQTMKLQSGTTVDLSVSKYDQTRTATEVSVEPESSDDWEIIESHAMFFQDEILHQTRIVTLEETLLCYIDNVVCKFTVKKIEPTTLVSARINTGSLIVVSPRENRARKHSNHVHAEQNKLNKPSTSYGSLDSIVKRSLYGAVKEEDNRMHIYTHVDEVVSRLAFVSILHNSLDLKHHGKQEKPENTVKHAKRVVVTTEGREDIPKGHVAMAPVVWDALWTNSRNGCKIIIEPLGQNEPRTNMKNLKVTLTTLNDGEQSGKNVRRSNAPAPEWTKELLGKLVKGPITDKTVLLKDKVLVELVDESTGKHVPYVEFTNSVLPRWNFLVASKGTLPNQIPSQDQHDLSFMQNSLKNDYISCDVTNELTDYLTMPVVPSSGVALTGNGGMGKTTVLKELARKVTLGHQRSVKYVDCNLLLEASNVGKMKQCIQEWSSLCYWHSPSLLFLDNAESLFPSIKTDDPQQQAMQQRGGSSSTKLALFLIKIVEGIRRKCPDAIRVVFTCRNKGELNSILFDKHFICETFTRKSPSVDERGDLLEFFFKRCEHIKRDESLQIRDIALQTEGYAPLDLQILVDKLFHQASMNMNLDSDELVVDEEVYQETIKGFSPSSLKGVKLAKGTGISWNDIGALTGPKRILLETLEWPTKYAPIFKNCPLQLRSGVLLYGYPGCGKTLLASAVAQQCGLNFITVNGPEILNKYIGASEQNVRELFERAQSVKPCILFFDEFDSIAPKRGHDSTGVTDRIVNQLLTQMDGVEGLDGVYVLAATSRPDLIDSALLRPGRIDKSVLCNVPGLDDRLDILQAITSSGKMVLEPQTDLAPIAAQTAGYSGADLQGLSYNAYLKSVHRTLQLQQTNPTTDQDQAQPETEYSVLNPNGSQIVIPETLYEAEKNPKDPAPPTAASPIAIGLQDLLQACQETKPSISVSEFRKLQAIYQKFQDDRDGNMLPGEGSTDVGTRTSLM